MAKGLFHSHHSYCVQRKLTSKKKTNERWNNQIRSRHITTSNRNPSVDWLNALKFYYYLIRMINGIVNCSNQSKPSRWRIAQPETKKKLKELNECFVKYREKEKLKKRPLLHFIIEWWFWTMGHCHEYITTILYWIESTWERKSRTNRKERSSL